MGFRERRKWRKVPFIVVCNMGNPTWVTEGASTRQFNRTQVRPDLSYVSYLDLYRILVGFQKLKQRRDTCNTGIRNFSTTDPITAEPEFYIPNATEMKVLIDKGTFEVVNRKLTIKGANILGGRILLAITGIETSHPTYNAPLVIQKSRG